MEKKLHFQMSIKSAELHDGKVKIKGFASTPDLDRYDDIVVPTAFASSIEQYMTNPVVLLQHNSNKVVGKVVDYSISTKGLEVTAEISNDIDNVFHNILE